MPESELNRLIKKTRSWWLLNQLWTHQILPCSIKTKGAIKEKKQKRNTTWSGGGGAAEQGKVFFWEEVKGHGLLSTPQTRQRGSWNHSKACWVCIPTTKTRLQYMNICLELYSWIFRHSINILLIKRDPIKTSQGPSIQTLIGQSTV